MATSRNRVATGETIGRVLVVAALGRELAALKRDADPRIALLETGEGASNAERVLRLRLETETPQAVVGIGFAGALSPSLGACELIVARQCRGGGSEAVTATQALLEAAARSQVAGDKFRSGVTVTVDYVLCRAEEKRRLANTLPPGEIGCVDMESSAVARVCADRGLPFLIARGVTDLFAEDLPVDFNGCRGSDGRVSNWKVLASALRQPSSVKSLWELRKRSVVCSEKLAIFVRRLVAELD